MNIAFGKTLPARLVRWALALAVLISLCFAVVSTRQLNTSIDQGNRKIILNYANQVAARLHDRFEQVDISLGKLGADLAEADGLTEAALLEEMAGYNQVWNADASGLLYQDGAAVLTDGTPVVFENKVSMLDVLSYSEQLNISRQTVNGVGMLVFAKPCRRTVDGRQVEAVFAAMELEALSDFLGDYGYGPGSFLALTHTSGDNVWRQGSAAGAEPENCFEDLESTDVSAQDSVLQMRTRMNVAMDGTIAYARDGREFYMAYVPLNVNYWYLLVSAQSDSIDLTELSRQHFTVSAVLVGIMVTMGMLGIVYLMLQNRKISQQNIQLQEAMEQVDLANAANAAKRDFLAKISHEIRTPLNGVMGMISLAEKDYPEKEKCMGHLEKATVAAQYLLGLLNDVLDMSKIESGKQKLILETVDMERLVREVETVVAPGAQAKGLSLRVDSSGLRQRYFRGDVLRLKQILTNLTDNAIKYTPTGGHILTEVTQAPGGPDAPVIFRIQDDGEGITPERQETIFLAFEQASLQRRGGVGLGLSLVRSFVELMGGTIRVDSAPGEGSTFTVTLPLPVEFPPEETARQAEAIDLTGLTLLLAEDNAINAEIAVSLLESRGATMTLAVDGQEAVDCFAQSPPGTYQAILMDIQMPRKDGIQATREIRAMDRPDAATIPIFAMTANAFQEQQDEMDQVGMNDYLYKPVDINAICACIRKWVPEG